MFQPASTPATRNATPGFIPNLTAQSFTFWRFLLAGIVTVVGGVGWLMTMSSDETQDKFGVTPFYQGREPKSDWVSVNGRLDWDTAAYEGSDYSGIWYVPMVSRNWSRGDKVKLVVKVSSHRAKDWGENEEVEGMLSSRLPNVVQNFFETEGPQLTDDVVMLSAGATPGQNKRLAHIIIIAGFLAIGGSLLLYNPDPHSPSGRSHSRRVPRTLGPTKSDLAELRGEVAPDDPKIVERENAVQLWMREHGLQKDEEELSLADDHAEQMS